MLTWIERIRIGMPPMICGTVSETAQTWAVERIDVEGDPDDHDAVVVGTGEGRGDRRQAESGAPLNGPARYILPTAWKGWPPGPAATFVVPIWLEAGQLGRACSARPRFCAAAAIAASGQ